MTKPAVEAWLATMPDTDVCVDWPFFVDPVTGYGTWRKRTASAVVCERHRGPCPKGKQCAHSCGRKVCVNPRHLRWATPEENQADKYEHGTDRRGAKHPLAKLTPEQVKEIRRRRGERHHVLAAEFGVGRTAVTRILNGTRW